MKALIVGGGIGGLVAGLFLHRHGIEAEILERADDVREIGVGINLLPHAVKELADLGLLPELERAGIRTRELIYSNRFGQTVWRELRGLDAGLESPQFSIHRGRLLGLIHNAVISRLGTGAVRTGSHVDRFHEVDGRVRVDVSDRRGKRWTTAGDLLIAADGIHSTVRAQLYPEEGAPIWSGVMLWRGCVRWPVWGDGRTMAIAGGNFAKFIFYPIAADIDAGVRLTNWAVMAKTGTQGASPERSENWSRLGNLADVLPFVRDRFRLDFVKPADIIQATGDFYEYPNCDRNPLPRWSFSRVTLLGDAAHPMYPVGSNGASQAILDARNLSGHLAAENTIEAALRAYDAERRPATNTIVLANRQGGPEGVIDLVEARAPDGFANIENIVSYREREAIVRGYASIAGFTKQ